MTSPMEAKARELETLKAHAEALAVALEAAQFGFNHNRCSICAGWNMGPNGETDHAHTRDCPVGIALAAYRKEFPTP